jgi:hypothetical protein
MVERLDFGPVQVDPDLILRLQKYRRLPTVPQAVKDVARQMAALAETLLEPRGWLWRGPITGVDGDGRVVVGRRLRFQSQTLARVMKDAAEAAIVVLTIGPGLERRAHALVGEEHYVEGLLLDTAGWAALDVLIKETRHRLAEEARSRGCRLTARTAPGFADWGLEQQGILFSAFDGADLTVRLNEAQVMLPRKSISGVYGLIPISRP